MNGCLGWNGLSALEGMMAYDEFTAKMVAKVTALEALLAKKDAEIDVLNKRIEKILIHKARLEREYRDYGTS